ncbi:hypothetical protein TeGR_g4813, partial [Tetraparma gracilis]
MFDGSAAPRKRVNLSGSHGPAPSRALTLARARHARSAREAEKRREAAACALQKRERGGRGRERAREWLGKVRGEGGWRALAAASFLGSSFLGSGSETTSGSQTSFSVPPAAQLGACPSRSLLHGVRLLLESLPELPPPGHPKALAQVEGLLALLEERAESRAAEAMEDEAEAMEDEAPSRPPSHHARLLPLVTDAFLLSPPLPPSTLRSLLRLSPSVPALFPPLLALPAGHLPPLLRALADDHSVAPRDLLEHPLPPGLPFPPGRAPRCVRALLGLLEADPPTNAATPAATPAAPPAAPPSAAAVLRNLLHILGSGGLLPQLAHAVCPPAPEQGAARRAEESDEDAGMDLGDGPPEPPPSDPKVG